MCVGLKRTKRASLLVEIAKSNGGGVERRVDSRRRYHRKSGLGTSRDGPGRVLEPGDGVRRVQVHRNHRLVGIGRTTIDGRVHRRGFNRRFGIHAAAHLLVVHAIKHAFKHPGRDVDRGRVPARLPRVHFASFPGASVVVRGVRFVRRTPSASSQRPNRYEAVPFNRRPPIDSLPRASLAPFGGDEPRGRCVRHLGRGPVPKPGLGSVHIRGGGPSGDDGIGARVANFESSGSGSGSLPSPSVPLVPPAGRRRAGRGGRPPHGSDPSHRAFARSLDLFLLQFRLLLRIYFG